MNRLLLGSLLVLLVVAVPTASAHNLISAYPDNRVINNAVMIPSVLDDSWFTLEVSDGNEIHYYQIDLERNQEVKTIQVLVPATNQPLDVYELNVIGTTTSLVAVPLEEPVLFTEEITQSDWYIIYDEEFVAPETDTYTFIISNESGESGKFAFTIGNEEKFILDSFIFILPSSIFQIKWFFDDWTFFILLFSALIIIDIVLVKKFRKK